MRIALVSPFSPLKGGIAACSEEFSQALHHAGHEVLTVPFKKLYPSFLFSLDSSSIPNNARLVLYNPLTWFSALRHIRRQKPDLLVIAYWGGLLAPLALLFSRFSGVRTILLLHNLTAHETFVGERALARWLLSSVAGVVTLSQTVSRQVQHITPSLPTLTLFHPIQQHSLSTLSKEEARQQLTLTSDAPVLLFFGYVRHYKGLDLLLQALPHVVAQEPTLHVVVAGYFYEPLERYQQLAERLGIARNITFHAGYVPSEQVTALFCAADGVVLPYRAATQSGVVPMAFAYGVPVIVTPVGALSEMVQHNVTGWIANTASPEALADALTAWLANRERWSAMRSSIEAARSNASWERFALECQPFFASFLDKGSR